MNPDPGALALAVKLLGSRERFESEIRAKLLAGGFEAAAADAVVAHLAGKGLLDDLRTARAYARRRTGRRSVGREALREELIARGAPEAVASEVAAGAGPEGAYEALAGKFGPGESRVRAARFLAGRGFSEEEAQAALDRVFGIGEHEE